MTVNKLVKYAIGLPLVGLTLLGSCTNHKRDFPPFYLNKTGTSTGIAIACKVDVEEGAKFYGPVVSFFSRNKGTVNGATISCIEENYGGINGVNASLANVSRGSNACVNGLEASLINFESRRPDDCIPPKINGIQVGLFANSARQESKCLQVGIYNVGYDADGTENKGIGINLGGYK